MYPSVCGGNLILIAQISKPYFWTTKEKKKTKGFSLKRKNLTREYTLTY